MPSQTAGSARAPEFGHAPTASESAHTEGEKNSGDGSRGREGERERERKRRLQHHLQRTRQGKAVHNRKRIKTQTRRKNPTKGKLVPTGFYMVHIVDLHKKIESVMGKHPSALETCSSVFLHQLKTLPKKQSSHQYTALAHTENAKNIAMILHILSSRRITR